MRWRLRAWGLAIAVIAAGACFGCATEPIRADRAPPTYGQCVEDCLLSCEHNDCRKAGLRPTGTRDGYCECGPWDA
jgi:hypothetical protein